MLESASILNTEILGFAVKWSNGMLGVREKEESEMTPSFSA